MSPAISGIDGAFPLEDFTALITFIAIGLTVPPRFMVEWLGLDVFVPPRRHHRNKTQESTGSIDTT